MIAFVCEDEQKARQFLEAADTLVTGRVGNFSVAEGQWPHYGWRRMLFLAEADVHRGALRTLRLPEHPPALRKALRGKSAEKFVPRELATLLPAQFLRSR